MGGHGYAVVTARAASIETEFVCIPRPIIGSQSADGGPLRYRVCHTVPRWTVGAKPVMAQEMVEGDVGLAI